MSGIAGALVDSALFLWLAFGSLDFMLGQFVGKLWATIAACLLLGCLSGRREAGWPLYRE